MNGEPLTGEERSARKLFQWLYIIFARDIAVAYNWDLTPLPGIFFTVCFKQPVHLASYPSRNEIVTHFQLLRLRQTSWRLMASSSVSRKGRAQPRIVVSRNPPGMSRLDLSPTQPMARIVCAKRRAL